MLVESIVYSMIYLVANDNVQSSWCLILIMHLIYFQISGPDHAGIMSTWQPQGSLQVTFQPAAIRYMLFPLPFKPLPRQS